MCKFTALDFFSLFISAASHDIDHPGNNNLYEIKTRSKLATLYNDVSVLENHHAASLFFILEDESCNIMSNLSSDQINVARKQMIENILYTDMTKHMALTNDLTNLPKKEDYDPQVKHKSEIMKALVHAADIGNPTRPFEIAKMWTIRILREFFS